MGTRRGTSTGLRVSVRFRSVGDERSSLPLFCSIDLVADRGRTAFANQKQKGCSPSLMKLVATQRMAGGDWRGSARARVHGGTSLHRSRGVGTSLGPQGEAWDVQQPLPPSKRRRTTRASFLLRNIRMMRIADPNAPNTGAHLRHSNEIRSIRMFLRQDVLDR